jgi:hypothetical protein
LASRRGRLGYIGGYDYGKAFDSKYRVLYRREYYSAVLIVHLFMFLGTMAQAQEQTPAQPVQSPSIGHLQNLSQTFRQVAQAVSPAVVYAWGTSIGFGTNDDYD